MDYLISRNDVSLVDKVNSVRKIIYVTAKVVVLASTISPQITTFVGLATIIMFALHVPIAQVLDVCVMKINAGKSIQWRRSEFT